LNHRRYYAAKLSTLFSLGRQNILFWLAYNLTMHAKISNFQLNLKTAKVIIVHN